MYYYLAFRYYNNDIKSFYFDDYIISESYLFRKEDRVMDKFINEKKILVDGYLIFDKIGFSEVLYLNTLTTEQNIIMFSSIIEKICKQKVSILC